MNLLILLIMFQIKHFLADYIFQTQRHIGKFKSGWAFVKPLAEHCLIHAFFTLMILAYFQALDKWHLAVLDFVVHFIMDRIKAGPRFLGRYKAIAAHNYELIDAMSMGLMPVVCTDAETAERQQWAIKRLRSNALFWQSLGFDQMVHHLTHYAIIWGMVS